MPPRTKAKCGNPLFLEWLEEMKAQADEKGMKSANAFGKAAQSMKLCPIKFDHPAECAQLVGVGPLIIDRLSKKFAAYRKENGLPELQSPAGVPKAPKKVAAKPKPVQSQEPHNGDKGGSTMPVASGSGSPSQSASQPKRKPLSDPDDSDSSDNGEPAFLRKKNLLAPSAKKAKQLKQPRAPKMYVPEKGSGAYSILLALLSFTTEQEQDVPCTKQDIIEVATNNRWSKTSFTTAVAGKYHTAWNGMKSLITKDLVYARGKPAQWSLTETGYELAKQLKASLGSLEKDSLDEPASSHHQSPSYPRSTAASSEGTAPLFRVDGSAPEASSSRVAGRGTGVPSKPSGKPDKFGFFFLDRNDTRVHAIDQARIRVDDAGNQLIRIEFLSSQRQLNFVKSNVLDAENAPLGRDSEAPTVFGWVMEGDVPIKAVGFPGRSPAVVPSQAYPPAAGRPSVPEPQVIASSSDPIDVSLPTSGLSRPKFPGSLPGTTYMEAPRIRSTSNPFAPSPTASTSNVPSVSLRVPTQPPPLPISNPTPLGGPSRSNQHLLEAHLPTPSVFHESDEHRTYATNSAASLSTEDSTGPSNPIIAHNDLSTSFAAIEPITWEYGTYDITLLLDVREVQSRAERDAFLDKIKATNVRVEGRPLSVGDMVWIARRKDGYGMGKEEEVVLDFVVERKRLDDLVYSIKDGRFLEQKHRLRNSGIGQVIYLIEDYNVAYQEQVWAPQIATAVSSTQIIEGFFVKRTQSLDATVEYLRCMHETIETLHEGANLTIIPDRNVSRPTYLALQKHLRQTHPSIPHLVSYGVYSELNAKSGSVTLRELWCKMLLTINGMSAEKVGAVVEVYGTPLNLWRAFQRAEREEERLMAEELAKGKVGKIPLAKELLADTVPGVGRRNIGKALSVKVYELLRGEAY